MYLYPFGSGTSGRLPPMEHAGERGCLRFKSLPVFSRCNVPKYYRKSTVEWELNSSWSNWTRAVGAVSRPGLREPFPGCFAWWDQIALKPPVTRLNYYLLLHDCMKKGADRVAEDAVCDPWIGRGRIPAGQHRRSMDSSCCLVCNCYSKASLVCLGIFLPQTLEAKVRKQLRPLGFRRRKEEEQFEKKKKKEVEEIPRVASLCVHLFITVAIYKSCKILQKARERRLVPLIS